MNAIEKRWNDLCGHFPRMADIPLHVNEKTTLVGYQAPYEDREWGVMVRATLFDQVGELHLIREMLRNAFPDREITADFMVTFCLLHEVGHHLHCELHMEQHGEADGRGWIESYSNAYWTFQQELDILSQGVIPWDVEDEMYRNIPHERIADELAMDLLKKVIEAESALQVA